jgi:polygalacturonase
MVSNIRLPRAILFLAVIVGCCLNACLARGKEPSSIHMVKPQKIFNINQYGAVEGGHFLCTEAIQKAIDTCANAGGGRVIVPSGTFLTGTVFLKNNVNLHLEENAILLGSPWIKNYPPQKPTTRRRYDWHLQTSLIFAQGAQGISVTGKGTLNGNSQAENDFRDGDRAGKYRPGLIWFDECTNVFVQGVTFTSAGFWTETYTMCCNVHVDGITVTDSSFHNNDGCNIIDCDNFLVENCNINALDDAICLKAYTSKGCNNVVIRNNRVRSLCNGIKAGTDSSGGFRNILIEDNEVYQTGIAGIALEIVDGGVMENVIVRNIKMDVVGTPIFIKLGERSRPIYVDGVETKVPMGVLRDVKISGIRATVDKAKKLNTDEERIHNYFPYASTITGIPGHYVENVVIDDVEIEIGGGFPQRTEEDAQRQIPENSKGYPENRMFGVLPAHGFYIRHVKNIKMTNIRIAIRQKDARSAFVLDDVHDSVFHGITMENVSPTPPFSVKSNCTGVEGTRK